MLSNVNPLAPIVVGSGFIVTVNPGVVLIAGVPTTIASTVVSLTSNATNYIYINTSGQVVVNTTGFPASNALPISTIVCSPTSITSIIDSRSDFQLPPTGSGAANTMFFPYGNTSSDVVTSAVVANKVQLSGFYLPNAVTFSNIVVFVGTGDGAHSYDWGIYNSSGALQAHVGAHTAAAINAVDLAVVGAPITLQPGKYYFGVTGTFASLGLGAADSTSSGAFTFLAITQSTTASSGGVLPATVNIPADLWVGGSSNAGVWAFALH